MTATDIKRVLAATDLLGGSRHVVPRSAQLARALNAKLSVLHVLPVDDPEGERGAEQERTVQALSRQVDDVADVDLHPEIETEEGVPGAIIEAEGERTEAGLFVLGFHREAPTAPKRLGSTMTHLLLHTKADVLLVKEPEDGPYRSILIAWDGTKDLKPAIERARIYAPEADVAVFLSVSLTRELADGEDKVRRTLKAVGLSPADISVHVSADGLLAGLREALREENADLLILPTRGSQGGDLGYVAAEILAQRPCDTLCLHQRI